MTLGVICHLKENMKREGREKKGDAHVKYITQVLDSRVRTIIAHLKDNYYSFHLTDILHNITSYYASIYDVCTWD